MFLVVVDGQPQPPDLADLHDLVLKPSAGFPKQDPAGIYPSPDLVPEPSPAYGIVHIGVKAVRSGPQTGIYP
ncbi:MAG: hypothetical protein A2Z37_08345 [Chloroflexi bacterium RBG_19FT_COMBO_62_14]|nr:MAG: hypothetical protein A2Z37_08345 [Chloroflexi bacterium RBG_19FT_COMBO_62_14]